MDPKAILAWLADKLGINEDGGAGEGDVEQDSIREGDAPAPDAENAPDNSADGADSGESAENVAEDTGDADGTDADGTDDEGTDEETLPDSQAELAQLRDSATVLATENERLRTILTDNGIDFDGDAVIEAAIVASDDDPDPEDDYDDEKAQADIDEQKRQIAAY
jgi:hypothetical protein